MIESDYRDVLKQAHKDTLEDFDHAMKMNELILAGTLLAELTDIEYMCQRAGVKLAGEC